MNAKTLTILALAALTIIACGDDSTIFDDTDYESVAPSWGEWPEPSRNGVPESNSTAVDTTREEEESTSAHEPREEHSSEQPTNSQPSTVERTNEEPSSTNSAPSTAPSSTSEEPTDLTDCERLQAGIGSFEGLSCVGTADAPIQVQGVDFTGADFTGAELRYVRFLNRHFTDMDFTDADFTDATLEHVLFGGGDFTGVDYSNSVLENVRFVSTDLSGLDLQRDLLWETSNMYCVYYEGHDPPIDTVPGWQNDDEDANSFFWDDNDSVLDLTDYTRVCGPVWW